MFIHGHIKKEVLNVLCCLSFQMGVALYNMALGLCVAAQDSRLGAPVLMAMCSTPNLATWDLVDIL